MYGMKRPALFVLLVLCLTFPRTPLFARDFPEPLPVFDALHGIGPESPAAFPASCILLRYDNFVFRGSDTDTFQIGLLGAFGLFQAGETFALKLSYGSTLLVGPLLPGDAAASVAEWWMNSVQFQYGIYGAVNLRGYHLLAEYSRMSNHPLRAKLSPEKGFENPASERIGGGIVFPPWEWGPVEFEGYIRGGYTDLFDYWQAPSIPEPRTRVLFRFGGGAEIPVRSGVLAFFKPVADIHLLRSGGTDFSLHAETGFTVRSQGGAFSLYLLYFRTEDTEEIIGRKQPVNLWGIGFSFSS
jgi:hypothetical protein